MPEKRSPLAKKVEKLFKQGVTTAPSTVGEAYPAYGELRVVQSVTTYSTCEEPIPNPKKQQ